MADDSAQGPVLLQGGAEMQPGCREMDQAFLASAAPGRLVVLLGAASPGADHERTSARALRYYEALVPQRRAAVAPHPEDDLDACAEQVAGAAVVVLPGGSPARLLSGLRQDGGRLAELLVAGCRAGQALSGSSAGAMVLCRRTVVPDGRPGVQDGLGLVPGLALVHDSGTGTGGWHDPDDPDGLRWGLPEQGGLLLIDGSVRAVGRGRVRVVHRGLSRVLTGPARTLADVVAG